MTKNSLVAVTVKGRWKKYEEIFQGGGNVPYLDYGGGYMTLYNDHKFNQTVHIK